MTPDFVIVFVILMLCSFFLSRAAGIVLTRDEVKEDLEEIEKIFNKSNVEWLNKCIEKDATIAELKSEIARLKERSADNA